MDETRSEPRVAPWPARHLAAAGGAWRVPVVLVYVLIATLIAGAAAPPAGLAVLVLGLLVALVIDFVSWQQDEHGPTATPSPRSRVYEPAAAPANDEARP